jgi:hypothetical protein
MHGSEWRNDLFPDHGSILLGCLPLGYSLVGVRAGLASLLLAFSRVVGMSRVSMLVVTGAVWVLVLVATTICRASSAGVGFTVRVGGRRRG